MKKQRSNERQRRNKANVIRRVTNANMAEHEPAEGARKWFSRPAYQSGNMIRAQGEQMEHKDLLDYLAEKMDVKGVICIDNK